MEGLIFGILQYLKALYEIRGKRRIHGKSLLTKVGLIVQISKFVRQLYNFHSFQVIIGAFFFGQMTCELIKYVSKYT